MGIIQNLLGQENLVTYRDLQPRVALIAIRTMASGVEIDFTTRSRVQVKLPQKFSVLYAVFCSNPTCLPLVYYVRLLSLRTWEQPSENASIVWLIIGWGRASLNSIWLV
jgi:hypothetical protein